MGISLVRSGIPFLQFSVGQFIVMGKQAIGQRVDELETLCANSVPPVRMATWK